MPLKIEAVYEDGILRPLTSLPLRDKEKVLLTVEPDQSWAERTAGMLVWNGDPELLRRVIEDEEYGVMESP